MEAKFDLLSTVEQGGCSAKIGASVLKKLLSTIELPTDERIEVDISSGDDAGVYRLNETTSLIVTTDFFPPVCSDAYQFGQIAATNSLSDVYAMGGKPLLVLNLNMFPSATIPIDVLGDILKGGQNKINESGAFTMGGHTIDDGVVKYGLAVVGTVKPGDLITNAGAKADDVLILTKPLGCGVVMAAHKLGLECGAGYDDAIESMKTLNDSAAQVMQKYRLKGATDITGFGLGGHLLSMATASGVSMAVDCTSIPYFESTVELLAAGCIPGAAFRNLEHLRGSGVQFDSSLSVEHKMLVCDAQTSGGILMCAPQGVAQQVLAELRSIDKCRHSAIIGRITSPDAQPLLFYASSK